jgi:predicted lysophospholipase L1 biosynthesis ABC-type transport system permease subunit
MNALDPWKTIVGVVGDVHGAGLDQPATAEVYSPLVTLNAAGKPWMPRNLAFIVRSSADASALARPVRSAMNAIDPALPLYRVMPLRDLLTAATARTSFTSLLLAIAALVATVIGGFGIYGVISYLVGLRTREIGVRLALGADSRDVRLLVTGQAMTDALIGVVLGAASSFVLARALQSSLADVKPLDAPVMLGASAALFMAAFVASWVPARRASRLDPWIALRAE